jgi:hypothetical protein
MGDTEPRRRAMSDDFDNDITPGVARALSRLGIDIHSAEQIADAYAAGRWILSQHTKSLKDEIEREINRRERRARRWLWTLAAVTAIVTPLVTLLISYIMRKFS